MAQRWPDGCSDAENWSPSEEGDAKCLVRSQRSYSLRNSSKRLHHHCWSLLSAIGPSGTKIQGKAGSNLLLAWQCETSSCKVDPRKIIEARMGDHSPSTLFSRLSSYGLAFVSVSVESSAREKIRQRERPQNGPWWLLSREVAGLLRTRDPYSTSALATSHR